MKKKSIIPNMLSILRMLGTLALVFVQPVTLPFFVIYTLCGVSDVLDGWIARATDSTSELGSRLDSAADLMFYVVMMLRILPELVKRLPQDIWYWVGGILLLRAGLYLTVALRFHRFSAVHTYLNKLTGVSVFLIPYFLNAAALLPVCFAACTIATVAAAEEWALHLTAKSYHPERKTILRLHPEEKQK
ncbi:MAG: CDP-alcohol phosphatidyltransferase family protein [Firmicutes bacterium]|nr:CDP-alcohol phosphatidyltransferase family protein [Bacillota bacterium]MDY2808359.1 CDP-alcohol phosphatidyltransferase family protein [Oscillospiraceae bacterium]